MKHGLHFAALLMALILALMLALPTLGLAEAAVDAAAQNDPVLFSFDGREFTLSDVNAELDYLLNGESLSDAHDYDAAIGNMIFNQVIHAKIAELGLDQFTEEEEEAFLSEAQLMWDQGVQEYVEYYLMDDTEEARAELAAQADASFTAQGYSVQILADDLKEQASFDLLLKLLLEDLNVTEEEIHAYYAQAVEQNKEAFAEDVGLYEFYQYYYGYAVLFTPDGYRGILRILLSADNDLLTALSDAQAAFEESKSDENPDGDASLQAAAEKAQAAVIASRQDVIDDIYIRLSQGESFQTLIAEYGEDPGMADPDQMETGYAVHPDSIIWDAAVTAGAFSEKMQMPGDVSDPVVDSNGIHILYYLRDIPGGAVEMTDEISQAIEENLLMEKFNSYYEEMLAAWIDEHDIIYYQDAIDAAKAGE